MSKFPLPARFGAAVTVAVVMLASPIGAAVADRRDAVGDNRRCDAKSRGSQHITMFGLTSEGRLLCTRLGETGRPASSEPVKGLVTDTRLVGIDVRPATGELYGLGDQGGIYTLTARSGQASLRSRLSVPLSGQSFGVDFNPVVDRLRIVSDTGQNLRANVDDGMTTVDAALNYVGPPAANPASGVTAVAYTNNDADPNTATTLFAIDATLDQVAIQAPPNAGVLNATGKLGIDVTGDAGFDILSFVDQGTTERVLGVAVVRTGNESRIVKINLLTGRAQAIGFAPAAMVDIALALDAN